MEFIDLDFIKSNIRATDFVPLAQIKRFCAIPIIENNKEIIVVTANPFDSVLKDIFQRLIRKKIIIKALINILSPHLKSLRTIIHTMFWSKNN